MSAYGRMLPGFDAIPVVADVADVART